MNEQIGTINGQAKQITSIGDSDFPLLEPPLTRERLIAELKHIGFLNCSTAYRKWIAAFYLTNNNKTLCVLFRPDGIDILLTSAQFSELLNSAGELCIIPQSGDNEFSEYHYSNRRVHINSKALQIAEMFIDGEDLDATLSSSSDISKNDRTNNYISNQNQKCRNNGGGGMSELYEAVSHGDGEAVYFGDGLWINSDGSMEDRGR